MTKRKKGIELALDVQTELLLHLLKHPKDFDKLPDRGVILPRSRIIVPTDRISRVGRFTVLPKTYSVEKLRKHVKLPE